MNRAQFTAIFILLAGVGWIASGMISGTGTDTRNAIADKPENFVEPIPQSVRITFSTAQPFQNSITLQGRTMASRMVELRAEVRGKVSEILVAEGNSVTKGQPIAKIEVNDRKARLDQSKAVLEQRKIQVTAARRLAKESYGTKVRLAEAEAQYQKAKADVVTYELDLANTVIKAPFDGVLDTRTIDEGGALNLGGQVGTIVDLDPLKVTAQISEKYVQDYSVGMPGSMILSNGTEIIGEISYVASVSDPNTRTFKIEMFVENKDSKILAGLAAQLKLPSSEMLAHKVSPSVLTLSDDGRIGIKTVEEDNTIRFWPIEILDDGPSGTWVSGLPETTSIVVVGQDYVGIGQIVTPVEALSGLELSSQS